VGAGWDGLPDWDVNGNLNLTHLCAEPATWN
jgi:hypothetical protein